MYMGGCHIQESSLNMYKGMCYHKDDNLFLMYSHKELLYFLLILMAYNNNNLLFNMTLWQ